MLNETLIHWCNKHRINPVLMETTKPLREEIERLEVENTAQRQLLSHAADRISTKHVGTRYLESRLTSCHEILEGDID